MVQERLSDGKGTAGRRGRQHLHIFTGDAPTALLTMSSVIASAGHRGPPRRGYATFFINPYGLNVLLGALRTGEMVEELHQGCRQAAAACSRGSIGTAPTSCCGATNVPLRDLNTALIAEQMWPGHPRST